jgi:hypothetical protein
MHTAGKKQGRLVSIAIDFYRLLLFSSAIDGNHSRAAHQITVEPGYNDIGLYDTSPIQSDILWYQLIYYC